MGIQERKARDFKRREKRILKVASRLFAEKGPDAVTIEMIAEAAEIAKGTVYKHFITKQEIYACILIDQYDKLAKLVEKNVLPDASLFDQAMQYVLTVFVFIEENKAYRFCRQSKHLLTQEKLSPAIFERLNQLYQQDYDRLSGIIREGMAAGLVIDYLSVDELTEISIGMFYGAFDAIMEMAVSDKKPIYEKFANLLINALLRKDI